jgi:translation elongation factor EF-G
LVGWIIPPINGMGHLKLSFLLTSQQVFFKTHLKRKQPSLPLRKILLNFCMLSTPRSKNQSKKPIEETAFQKICI